MTKILVVSLRFHPGHFSHLIATYNLILDAGLEPILYVHPGFKQMDLKEKYQKIYSPTELYKLGAVRAAVFWFPSAKNIWEILRVRLSTFTRVNIGGLIETSRRSL